MARQLHHHPAWSADGRAAELASAGDRLELMTTENLSVAAAFDLSYADLAGISSGFSAGWACIPAADFDALRRRRPARHGPDRRAPRSRGPV